MTRKLFLSFVFFVICSTVSSQILVHGHVFDGIGNTLPGSEIRLSKQEQILTTFSNEEGSFSFNNVNKGTYDLLVIAGDYSEFKTIEIDTKDYEVNVYVEEMNSNQLLDDMIIQIESVKSRLEKEGFAVTVIETEEAALRNIQTNELLDRSVGVRVRQNGGLGSSANYNLNGMSGNSVKIFIDGIPISTYGSSFNLNSIPPALIERIEVYKGVVPIHLSDDALGGAINVVLKKGVRNSFNASVSYGSFNTFQGNFSGVTRNSNNGLTVKASGFYNYSDNDYEVWGKFVKNTLPNGRLEQVRAKRLNDAYKSIGGQVEVGFTDVKLADQFFIGFNGSDSYREIQHGTYMTKPYMGRFEESDAQVFNLTYRKDDFLAKGLNFNLTAMHSKRHQMVNDTVKWNYNWFGEKNLDLYGNPILSSTGAQQGAPTINHSNRSVYTLRGDLTYEITPNHRLVLNHLYYNFDRQDDDEMKTGLERSFIEDRSLTKSITGFAYEMKAFESKLKTNLFSKYYKQSLKKINPTVQTIDGVKQRVDEHFSNSYDYIGYGIAASYLFEPSIVILSSFEKAVRLPVDSEIFGDIGENIIENNSLRAEISNNINLGVKFGPYKIKEHKFSFGTNAFVRNTKDRIAQRSNTRINDAEQTTPFENLDKTKSKGFEIELFYEFNERMIVFANASRFQTVFNKKYDQNGNLFGYYNQQLPNEPFFTASGSVQYAIDNVFLKDTKLNLHYGFNMIDPFYTNWLEMESFRTPKQFIQDVGLSYEFPNKQFVLSFDVKNIFNKEAYDNFAVQKPGRAFYLKLNYSFNKF